MEGVARDRERHTETLVPVERAGFDGTTASMFDPTTRRVSTRALKSLIAETIDQEGPTRYISPKERPPPLKSKGKRILEELKARRSGEAVSETFGRYVLLGSVGKGGMAEVRLAAEHVDGSVRLCVVKRIAEDAENRESLSHGLREEARVSWRLEHPNVVKVLSSGEHEGAPYLVFELIDGVSLRELTEIVKPLRVPLLGVLEVGRACASALAHAHAAVSDDGQPLNVVHRDATPQNVLVARGGIVKLVDFGIARFEGRDHHTQHGHVKGKLGYMSPEQCRAGPVDGKTDVFSLGLVLTELIAGERVLPPTFIIMSESESLIRARLARAQYLVPPALAELLVRMTALEAKDRPSAEEVEREIGAIAAGIEDGETLAEFVEQNVFAKLEPFEDAVAIDPPTPTPTAVQDPITWDPTDTGYARTLMLLRPASGPKDDAKTRPVSRSMWAPPPIDDDLEPPPSGRGMFFFVLAAAILAFFTLVFVLVR
jgi:serine/threonine protein kinase